MGGALSTLLARVGTDPYYAGYEKSFERLAGDIARLEVGVRGRLGR